MTTPLHLPLRPPTRRGEPDIFLAKTPREISKVYNKLLVTVGKWNADMYLKIQTKLDKDRSNEIPKLCPEATGIIESKKCVFQTGDKPLDFYDSTACQKIYQECEPENPIKTSYPIEEPGFETEPTYKKIFKNARNSRKPSRDDWVLLSQTPSAPRETPSGTTTASLTQEVSSSGRQCELMPDAENNYLLQVRERRKSSKKKRSEDEEGVCDELDDIAALFHEIPVKQVMQDHLTDQIELNKASIGERLIKADPDDELKGLSYLKTVMLGNERFIDEFQEKMNDGRWRKKFNLEKIELSDEVDTTDGSEIYISDSSSLCSGDSMNTSVDGKAQRRKPSRIPFIDEIHRKRDALYQKISMKWEKVVQKNSIEPNLRLTPVFRSMYTKARLRSHYLFYGKILGSLNSKFEAMYPKKFVPYKHRLRNWIRKDLECQAAADQLTTERKRIETLQGSATTKPPKEEHKFIDYSPTKYQTKNQRIRLKRIMKDVENSGKEGLTDWSKRAFFQDYVNLRPIISTKGDPKAERHTRPQTSRFIPAASSSKIQLIDQLWQPSLTESSIYYDSVSTASNKKKGLSYVRFDMEN